MGIKNLECADVRYQTPHCYYDHRVEPVEAVVVHYTASPRGNDPMGSDYDRIRRWALGHGRESSTNVVIHRDGRIVQTCGLDRRSWHVGSAKWPRDGQRIQHRSLGVDLENVGYLKQHVHKWVNAYDHGYFGPTPFSDCNGKHWEPYTGAQVQSFLRVVDELRTIFPQLCDGFRWVGHEDLDRSPRGPKSDPGFAFADVMAYVREAVQSRDPVTFAALRGL